MNGRSIRPGALAGAGPVRFHTVVGEPGEGDWRAIGAVKNPDTDPVR